MPKITDTDRINFIQMLMQSKSYRHFKIQAIGPGNQMYSEESKLQIFTIPSQHQYGRTVRDVIDIAMGLYKERKGMI